MALLSQLYPLQNGPTGPTGAAGQTGAVGQTGAQGNTGNTGETGVAGQTGAQGNTGNTGFTGATGTNGTNGAQGNTGNTGETGAVGQTGAQGNTGNTGFTGPTGQTGLAGDKYTTTSTTNETIGTGSKTFTVGSGLAYSTGQSVIIAFDSSNKMEGSVTSYSGTTLVVNVTSITGSGTYNSWSVSLSGAPGPAGATGNTGNTGFTGATGTNGSNGAQGNTGNTGATGPAGDYSMWTLTNGAVLGNTNNLTEYLIKFNNVVANSNTAVLSAGGDNGNIEIKETGVYLIDIRYSSYDLFDDGDTLGVWIRGNTTEITTGNGGSAIRRSDRSGALDEVAGSYSVMFTTTLRVESVPYFIAGTFLHNGASGGTGGQGYPDVTDNTARPYLIVHKLRNL